MFPPDFTSVRATPMLLDLSLVLILGVKISPTSPKLMPKNPNESSSKLGFSSDSPTSSKGVVQVESGKGSDKSDAPSDNNDVKKFVDFVGVQELNVGESDDKPNFEDD